MLRCGMYGFHHEKDSDSQMQGDLTPMYMYNK